MDLSPTETAVVELLRAMGSEPLHVAFTSTGAGVAVTIVEGAMHMAGFGPTAEEAFANLFVIPEPEPQPAAETKPPPFRVVAGTDRRPG